MEENHHHTKKPHLPLEVVFQSDENKSMSPPEEKDRDPLPGPNPESPHSPSHNKQLKISPPVFEEDIEGENPDAEDKKHTVSFEEMRDIDDNPDMSAHLAFNQFRLQNMN